MRWALLLPLLACTAAPAPRPAADAAEVELELMPGGVLLTRSTREPAALLGAFVPDDVPLAELDEQKLVRTACSAHFLVRALDVSGDGEMVLTASREASERRRATSL
ncbi:MAG: hypothetical protein ACK4N5_10900, partial [Myxococcales bacterium]